MVLSSWAYKDFKLGAHTRGPSDLYFRLLRWRYYFGAWGPSLRATLTSLGRAGRETNRIRHTLHRSVM